MRPKEKIKSLNLDLIEREFTIKELYNLDCKIIGVSSKEFKTLAKRPKYSLLNKSKIKTTFNLEIPDYKQSLKNCIEIIKNEA